MGVTIINSGLKQEKGITYSEITDSSADWGSVTNGAYFYDIATDLPYYKSSAGLILSLFSEANTIYTADGALTGDRNVDSNGNTLTFSGNNTSFTSSDSNALTNILEVQDSSNNKIFEVREGSNVLINAQGSLGSSALSIYDGSNAKIIDFSDNGRVNFSSLPTNAAGLSSGDLWDDGGIVRIGTTPLADHDSLYTIDSTIGTSRVATLTDNLTFQGGNIFTTINSSSTDESDIESYPLTLRNTELRANNLVGMLFQDNSTDDQARIYTKFGTKNSLNFDVKDSTFQNLLKLEGSNVNMSNLPTASTGLSSGDLWNENGVVRIGTSGGAIGGGGDSIYTADGTLTEDRTVSQDGNDLTFNTGVNGTFFVDASSNTNQNVFEVNAGSHPIFGLGSLTIGEFGNLEIKGTNSNGNFKVLTILGNELFTLDGNGNNSTLRTKGFDIGTSTTTGYKLSLDAGRHEFIRNTIMGANFDLVNSQVKFWEAGMTSRKFIIGGSSLIGTEKISLQGDTLISKQLELSSTEDGLLMNRLTTAQRDAISTPDTHLLIFNTDNNIIERWDGTKWVPQAGYGMLSINDSDGIPTFYNNYTSAIAAAASGDTIEQLANIEDSSGTLVNINKSLTINLNGFTYTNSSTGTSDGVQVSTTDKVKILNGTIKRINGTYGTTQNRAIVLTASGDLEVTGTDVINDTGLSLYSTGVGTKVLNGRFTTTSQTINQVSVQSSASLVGTVFESSAYNNFQGVLYNVKATSTTSNTLIGSTSEARFCEFRQTNSGGYDALLISAGAKAFYCECFNVSTSYAALRISGANTEIRYCLGYSTLDFGIEVGTGNPKGIYNCTGINETGSYGGRFSNIDEIKDSSFTSITGSGGVWCSASDVLIDSCIFKVEIASSFRRGFYDSSSTGIVRVYNSLIETAGSGAGNDSMLFTSGRTVYLANNRLRGGNGINNVNGNSQTTAADSTGNIILD